MSDCHEISKSQQRRLAIQQTENDHEHEWVFDFYRAIYCKVLGCNKKLSFHTATAILNEHAKLKRVRDAANEFVSYDGQDIYYGTPKQGMKLIDALADTQKKD